MYIRQAVPFAAAVLIILSTTAFAQTETTYAELPRFQQVNEKLYRSAQPRAGGLARLRELGFNTVLNLRGANEQTRAEETEARALGLNYFNIELPGWGRPQDARVARVLEIITTPENGRVLIHCKDGVDRTGMIVALYRLTYDHWTTQKALAEAERNGMRGTQFWMRDYVKDYGDRVAERGPDAMLKSASAGDSFDDRIGASMRAVEKGAFHARKAAGQFFRLCSNSLR